MRLLEVQIHNYKSLRSTSITPSPLTVLVGPNAAGKTNFCDALDFLGEVYRLGLEVAIARKGGYENICYRRQRRSKAPIRFHISFELTAAEWEWPLVLEKRRQAGSMNICFEHTFEMRAESQNIKAPFHIGSERIRAHVEPREKVQHTLPLFKDSETDRVLFSCSRDENRIVEFDFSGLEELIGTRSLVRSLVPQTDEFKEHYPSTVLLLSLVERVFLGMSPFQSTIGSLRVFQLSPKSCRESGVPTPNPELDHFGGNLPAVIEYLKTHYSERYSHLLSTVRRVMPTLSDLETQYTHRKTLGLFISEEGFGRPWAAEDISDGTIQIIALLAAVFDPRARIVVIEEPENSVHPWAVRQFIEAAREASRSKQVILTTHSPILIDQLKPTELWVATRPKGETVLTAALQLAPSLQDAWDGGLATLSEYLDSGAIPEAVPGE